MNTLPQTKSFSEICNQLKQIGLPFIYALVPDKYNKVDPYPRIVTMTGERTSIGYSGVISFHSSLSFPAEKYYEKGWVVSEEEFWKNKRVLKHE